MDYKYIKEYQGNEHLLKSYYNFTQSVFGFDLTIWKNAGHWGKKYRLHSLVDNDRIIASISASIMKLQIMGKDVFAIQLGSVGVLPEYRGRGLLRKLMEKVLAEYNEFSLIFLFANQSVLDFYPRFGFRRVEEKIFQFDVADDCLPIGKVTKINIESECLRRLLTATLQGSSIIDARGNHSIYWFHLLYKYSQNIYYIEEKDIVFIVNYEGECAVVADVLSMNLINFDEIIGYIRRHDTKKVIFNFTPDWLGKDYEATFNEDDIMFVLGEFPVDIADFKFPTTAHT